MNRRQRVTKFSLWNVLIARAWLVWSKSDPWLINCGLASECEHGANIEGPYHSEQPVRRQGRSRDGITTMRGKPIAEIQHHGKRVRIDFAHQKRGVTIRYDVVVDGEPVLSAVFAEEVMRWLADALARRCNA